MDYEMKAWYEFEKMRERHEGVSISNEVISSLVVAQAIYDLQEFIDYKVTFICGQIIEESNAIQDLIVKEM
jgi:hypothetical protein